MPRTVLIGIATLVLAGAGLVIARLHADEPQQVAIVEETHAPARTPEPHLVVDVSGAVAHPGVYRLPGGSRVVDALLAAGGMTGEADLAALNKAAPIHDGQRIYVPRPGEMVPPGSATSVLRPGPEWPGRRLHTLNRAGRLECIDGSATARRF